MFRARLEKIAPAIMAPFADVSLRINGTMTLHADILAGLTDIR